MRERFRTARAVIQWEEHFLLAVHSSFWRTPHKRKWGLLGGRIERGEDAATALQRELKEELDASFDDLTEIGPFHYKRADHMVYGTRSAYRLTHYDRNELLDMKWFTLAQIEKLHRQSKLHAGYELDAIKRLLVLRENA